MPQNDPNPVAKAKTATKTSSKKATNSAGAKAVSDVANDPKAVREDIAETREELGGTVDALASKADVREQAKQRAAAGGRALRSGGSRLAERSGQAAVKAREAMPDAPVQMAKNAIRLMSLQPKKAAAIGAGALTAAVVVWAAVRRRDKR